MSVSNHATTVYCKGLINLEYEKKKEYERRKKLRLLQVREQSKDFANKIRTNVETESKILRNKAVARAAKELEDKRIQEINLLKEKYKKCLEKIGESHLEAAKQPNIALIKEAEMARNKTAAALRAAKARRFQLEQEALHRDVMEAPIKQKKITRMKENIRSGYISSLPKPSEQPHRQQTVSHKKQPTDSCPTMKASLRVLQDLPTNIQPSQPAVRSPVKPHRTSVVSPTHMEFMEPAKPPQPTTRYNVMAPMGDSSVGLIHRSTRDQKHQPATKGSKTTGALTAESVNDCTCDYYVCFCHESPKSLRRCSSEANVSLWDLEEKKESPTKRKSRSRSCSPPGGRSVRTLNHCDVGNLYQSSQPSRARVTHHSISEQHKEQKMEIESKPVAAGKKISKEELKRRTDIRSASALRREFVRRRFQKFLEDLETLGRNRALRRQITWSKSGLFQRERDIVAKNETKQKKLVDAFEVVLNTDDQPKTRNTGSSVQIQECEPEVMSPPILNLASYQEMHIPRRKSKPTVAYDDVDALQTSIPSSPSQTTSGLRYSNKTSPTRTRKSLSPKQPTGSSGLSTIKSQGEASVTTAPSSNVEVVVEINDKEKPSSSSAVTENKSPELSSPNIATSNVRTKENHSKPHKKKCKKKLSVPPLDSSTSYYSPPENVSPAQRCYVDAIISKLNRNEISSEVRKYIYRLLSMSRYSIDNLNELSSSSSSECLDTVRESLGRETEEDIAKLSELTELYVDRFNTLVEMFERVRPPESPVRFLSPPRMEIPSQYIPPVNIASNISSTQAIPPKAQEPHSSRPGPSHTISRREPSPIRRPHRSTLSPSSSSSSDSSMDSTVRKTCRKISKMPSKNEPTKSQVLPQNLHFTSLPTMNTLASQNEVIKKVRSHPNSDASSRSLTTETFQTLLSQETPASALSNQRQGEEIVEIKEQNPFSDMLNLLPHPEEVFRQQPSSDQPPLSPNVRSPPSEIHTDHQYQLGCGDGNFRVPLEDNQFKLDFCSPAGEDGSNGSFHKNSVKQRVGVDLLNEIRVRLNKISEDQFGGVLPSLQLDKNSDEVQDPKQSEMKSPNPSPDLNAAVEAANLEQHTASGRSSVLSIISSNISLTDIDVNKSVTLNIVLDNLRKDTNKSDDSGS